MGLAYQPDYELKAENKDITDAIRKGLLSLSVDDHAGVKSDRLSLQLAWPHGRKTPPRGAVLQLSLGFKGTLQPKGRYIVDDISVQGPPRKLSIQASAAPMDPRKQKGVMQSQKNRSFDQITLGALVETIAQESGLIARIAEQLAQIELAHIDQSNESNMNLLQRLALRYGAVFKPSGEYLLFLKQRQAKTASGQLLAELSVQPTDVTDWQVRQSSREVRRKVIACYHDVEQGEPVEVSVGQGVPAQRLTFRYVSLDAAKAAATAQAKKQQGRVATLDLSMPAHPKWLSLTPLGIMKLSGFGDAEDGRWQVQSLNWVLSSSGFTLKVHAEQFNAD